MSAARANFDVLVIGGGIVGLAVLHRMLERHPTLSACLVEKEDELATHQTGRNSGVVHSGLYYRPGSLKATLCVTGRHALLEFCDAHDVPYDLCGKLVVATSEAEIPRLDELERRGQANLPEPVTRLGPDALREIEPHAAGIAALHVPCTGIVDYPRMCEALATLARSRGADVRTGARFERAIDENDGMRVVLSNGEVTARRVVNCAGLFADRIAVALGAKPDVRIVPFRGEYYELTPDADHLVRGLIYPVPDPRFPFLGVHFTRMVGGGVEVGPNAVLAWKREGYRHRDVSVRDMADYLLYPGFWSLALKHGTMAIGEWYRSFLKHAFVRSAQRLVPDVRSAHMTRAGAGVRAQALARHGALLDDFALVKTGAILHVLNAPSPAATASLAIADRIVDEIDTMHPAPV